MPDGREKFGAFIRREREAKEIGLREMARKIGVSPTYLSQVERDEFSPPAEDKVRKIAEIIGQDVDELLALAGRVASDLKDIIRERPREMANLLRAAKGLTAEEMASLAQQARMLAERPDLQPELPKLLALCREANKAGRDDEEVVEAAKRLDWQLAWASGHHLGKRLRRHRGRIAVEGILSPPTRPSPPLTDVRRMLKRLKANDLVGFGKAFCEASPYVQDRVRRTLWELSPETRLFRTELPMTPCDYALVVQALEVLAQDPKLRTRPVQEEHDRCVRLAWSIFEWLSGRTYRGLSNDPSSNAPHGRLHRFLLAISRLYGLPLVTERSAARVRKISGGRATEKPT